MRILATLLRSDGGRARVCGYDVERDAHQAETVTAAVADATLLPRIVRELDHRGIEIAEFTMRKASLDEVFLTLTGHLPEPDQTDPSGEREDDHR